MKKIWQIDKYVKLNICPSFLFSCGPHPPCGLIPFSSSSFHSPSHTGVYCMFVKDYFHIVVTAAACGTDSTQTIAALDLSLDLLTVWKYCVCKPDYKQLEYDRLGEKWFQEQRQLRSTCILRVVPFSAITYFDFLYLFDSRTVRYVEINRLNLLFIIKCGFNE